MFPRPPHLRFAAAAFPGPGPCRRAGGFALVVTLLIVSLLAVVAVSFLTSMNSERQTADAFTAKTRAEQAAQAGVDAAAAMLCESFRDFPDSCTVWDPQQSANTGTPNNALTVNTPYNEGTTLYLRAVVDPATGAANPFPGGAAPLPADAPNGNNPNNPACQTCVLPLVSGVPKGQALPASKKATILPPLDLTEMDPDRQTDPAKAYGVDLNARRFGVSPANPSGDLQGTIGSPPDWAAGVGGVVPKGPKPARAPWVNVYSTAKDANGKSPVTARYAFWVEDESFRANHNLAGTGTAPPDNPLRPLQDPNSAFDPVKNPRRPPRPGDLTLAGPLALAGDANAGTDADALAQTRGYYPASFFPDPLAFSHAFASSPPPPALDWLRYLTTHQSGTLNLTRHGTQRLNLNAVVPYTDPNAPVPLQTMQTQIDQIVQTLQFHLPSFGQRFYRLTTDAKAATLNDAAQVPGGPRVSPYPRGTPGDHAEIYYYKVAANLRDYLDSDAQPTLIDPGGTVRAPAKPDGPLNSVEGNNSNEIWAQGKEASPYLQEAALRIQASINDYFPAPDEGTPDLHDNDTHGFLLSVDYYLEFWNMSDRDIYASPQSDLKLPNLRGATVLVTNQNAWQVTHNTQPPYNFDEVLYCDGATPAERMKLANGGPPLDYEIDLTNGVQLNGKNGPAVPGGVVFKAGAVTVITTDPGCDTYNFIAPKGQTPLPNPPSGNIWSAFINPHSTNPRTTYYCSHLLRGTRQYQGTKTIPPHHKGIQPVFRHSPPNLNPSDCYDTETEITLCNPSGYLDSVAFALAERYYGTTWYTDDPVKTPGYNDYSYSSGLAGNFTDVDPSPPRGLSDQGVPIKPRISQLGDPRTNNEQLSILFDYGSTGYGSDQSHYFYGLGGDTSLGYINPSQKPDALPTGAKPGFPWPDYLTVPYGQYFATAPLRPPMDAASAPMVVADGPLTSIGQLGDVFDPARLPGAPGQIAYSRGGGRTFKIGQRDDRYCADPTGSASSPDPARLLDFVPASNAWAAWRLADVFSVDDATELPARININGVRRDNGAALLAALDGFKFQPATSTTDPQPGTLDPVIHGDSHGGAAASPANAALDPASPVSGFSQLVSQMKARLDSASPVGASGAPVPSGPFFERGELGEIADPAGNALFGMSDPLGAGQASGTSTALVPGVDMYKSFDHSREELFRRIGELICTRGDTFTVYTVGQSIVQASPTAPLKVTGTHRMRVTFRLVPIDAKGKVFQPSIQSPPATTPDLLASGRFLKPDHYNVQVLSANTF